jgi:nitroreductase
MELPLTPREVLTTTRSVRKRLDFARPVERDIVEDCLSIAFQAPNGSNQQQWDWVLVDDAERRAEMATIYRAGLADHLALPDRQAYTVQDRQNQIATSVYHLIEHLHEVPVLVVPCVTTRFEGASVFEQASHWGSILPAVWSFMLALRTRGMGSAWTTLHLHREAEMAELLGIPFAEVTQAGLFPVAYTIGTDFSPANRAASNDAIHWNHW